MNDALLFAIGSLVFLFTSVVTLRFMALRFGELREAAQAGADEPDSSPLGESGNPPTEPAAVTDGGADSPVA